MKPEERALFDEVVQNIPRLLTEIVQRGEAGGMSLDDACSAALSGATTAVFVTAMMYAPGAKAHEVIQMITDQLRELAKPGAVTMTVLSIEQEGHA